MQTQLIQHEAALSALIPEWQRLQPASPMMSSTWMMLWWERFQKRALPDQEQALFVLTVREDSGELIGLAPWYVSGQRGERRVLKFLGSGAVCSDHLTILCHPDRIREVAAQIVIFLYQGRIRSLWNECDFDGVDQDDPVMQAVVAAFQGEDDALVCVRRATSTWQMALPDTWEAYLSGLSKNRRKRIRRLQRTYLESGRIEYQVLQQKADFDKFFEKLVSLHNRRRNELGETGVFECPAFRSFHREAMQALLAEDRLHCSLLYLDGEPVAAEYLFKQADSLFAYQSGLDPAAMEHSPGTLSLLATLQSAIESGVKTFDFLRGDEDYKSNWSATARPALRVRIRKRSLLAYAQHLIDQCKDSLRQFREPCVAHAEVD